MGNAFRFLVLLALGLGGAIPLDAQTVDVDEPARLVARLESILQAGARTELAALAAPNVPSDMLEAFAADAFAESVTRAVVRERDRVPLDGALTGDGYRLIVEILTEIDGRARVMSARIDVERIHDGGADSWRIVDLERLSLVEGLYRLTLDVAHAFPARELVLESEDVTLTLHDGFVFQVASDAGTTGVVLLGRGDMRFVPSPQTEQGQLRIFSGADSLLATFDAAFVRMNPLDYETQVGTRLTRVQPDRRVVRRAQDVFAREAPRSFNIDLADLSRDEWFLVPQSGDFLAEVRTRRFGTLTYSKSAMQAEDVTLFNRERRRTIALYASKAKLASRGPFYNEDDLLDYDVTSYDIDVSVDPERETIEGRARVTLRTKAPFLSTLTLRLANGLTVSNIVSPQLGRVLFLRVRNQNGIVVNLPGAVPPNTELTLVVSYGGRVNSQRVDSEGAQVQQGGPDEPAAFELERSYLLSNRSYWYPQNAASDYATARVRVGVPDGYGCVASGEIVTGGDVPLRDLLAPVLQGRAFVFNAPDPLRYLTVIVGRLAPAVATTVSTGETAATPSRLSASAPRRERIALTIEANPSLVAQGRALAPVAEDIVRFYGALMNDTPYPSMTIALVENELPGGHSPAYATMLNGPPPSSQFLWRNDPAAFSNFPEFFIAHELAHQWWGQAVGWKNYHEQWISEGIAQYFSALYAQRARGDATFVEMLRQFRRWALAESDQGPIYLGYRLGHVKGDTRIFRALIYNKGAAVLHMLRRLIGDETFFAGLRRFYAEQKYRKAGTDDLQRAFEAEARVPLARFFDNWIYSSEIPRLRYASAVGAGEVVVSFDQLGGRLVDIPVTVSITYADGRVTDVMVPVTDRHVERRIRTDAPVRQVQVNRDFGAVAEFENAARNR